VFSINMEAIAFKVLQNNIDTTPKSP